MLTKLFSLLLLLPTLSWASDCVIRPNIKKEYTHETFHSATEAKTFVKKHKGGKLLVDAQNKDVIVVVYPEDQLVGNWPDDC